jgi:hypothetical protein
MTEFPSSFAYQGFFFVNSVTPFQEGDFDEIRLPEEIKVFGPFHEQGNDVSFRFPVKNTIVFKGRIAEDGKPMGTPPPFIYQSPPVSPEGKPFVIRGKEAEAPTIPPGKVPCRNLFTERNGQREIVP